MLSQAINHPLAFLVLVAMLVAAVTLHEFAHAWTADRLGDPTPRSQGRVTLNPLSHLSLWGSLALLIFGFGWGNPVPFDPYNLRSPRRDIAFIAAAGPLTNLILAWCSFVLAGLAGGELAWLFQAFASLNIVLATFNLIPIHPLDGGKILSALLPPEYAAEFDTTLQQYGTLILLMLILPLVNGQSALSALLGPAVALTGALVQTLASWVLRLIS